MRGKGIGTLSVYMATKYGILDNKIWAKTDDQGAGWNKAKLKLSNDKDFQIILNAEIGISNRGDIAIDDVIFSPDCVFNGKLLPGKL